MKRIVLAGILSLTQSVWAGAWEDAGAAYQRGDYTAAANLMRPLAVKGDANAQANLAGLYHDGQGVKQDFAEALKWYRLAAVQGAPKAQSNLGFMYANGEGVPVDYVKAHLWWNLAAMSGDTDAAKNRDLAGEQLTPAQMDEAAKLAQACLAKELKGCD